MVNHATLSNQNKGAHNARQADGSATLILSLMVIFAPLALMAVSVLGNLH